MKVYSKNSVTLTLCREASRLWIFVALVWNVCLVNSEDCLSSGETNALAPKCKIVDNVQPSELNPSPGPSYECIRKWPNTFYLQKEGDASIDCVADYPLDLEYDGVLPTSGLRIQYYKNISMSDGLSSDLTSFPMTYGIKIHLIGRELTWSANYIIHEVSNVNNSMEISVFIGKNDLPIFLPLRHEEPLETYWDGETLVIPCRVSNYNSTVKLYKDFGHVERDDSESMWYDPRRGFYIKPIPGSDEEIDPDQLSGNYECSAKFHSTTDRIKTHEVKIKIGGGEDGDDDDDEDDEDDEEKDSESISAVDNEATLQNITGTISFERAENNTYNAYCQLPTSTVDLESLAFTNVYSKSPTFSRLERKCLGFDHGCDERKKLGDWEMEDPRPKIESVFPSGLMKCFDKSQQEVMEYFIGSDDDFYTDWNDALSKNALIKVEPPRLPGSDSTFIAGRSYDFHCKYTQYIAAFPVWWAIKFQNGTIFEEFKYSSKSTYALDIEHTEIHCGITFWNQTIWYKHFIPLEVKEPVALPVFLEKNKLVPFKENAENQGLRCEVLAEPKATLEWFRDGEPVGDSIPTISFGDSLVLFFTNINTTYEGNYTCVATTSGGGRDEAKFQIILERNDTQEADENEDKAIKLDDEVPECKNSSTISLFHLGSDNEISSLELVNPNEVLLLRLDENNCLLEPSPQNQQKLWIRVIGSGNNELSSFLKEPENISANEDELDLGGMDDSGPLILELNITEDQEASEVSKVSTVSSSSSSEKLLSQLLLPMLFGFASILLILIIAYISYSYYVSPWKIQKITRVSTIKTNNNKPEGMI